MKNLKKWSFLLFSILFAMIISCKQNTTGTFIGSDKKPLTINIMSNDDINFAKNTASRTIMADAYKTDDELYFYLWGSATGGVTLNPKRLVVTPDAADSATGTVILDIDCYNWELTLAACDVDLGDTPETSTILADAVLIGYGNVDMMFSNSINFTLSPKGLTKPGYVDIDISLEAGTVIPAGYAVKANIYNKITGEPIKTTGNATLEQSLMAAANSTTDATTFGTKTYAVTGDSKIAPGTYLFQVEFVKEGELRKFVWHDNIIILPGRTADDPIVIPNKIGTKPNAPTALTVTFNSDEEEVAVKGKYPVTITWNQNTVDNELYFALQIAELNDDLPDGVTLAAVNTATNFDTIWNTPGNYKDKWEFNYLNDIRKDLRFYKEGSLFSNNTEIQIYLELGKRYILRMYSENNAGYSDPAYVTTITPPDTGATTLNTINRFKVTYNNQGGTWTLPDNSTSTAKIVKYWSQSDKDYEVINPADSNSTYKLTKSPASFIYWKKSMAGDYWPSYDRQTNTYIPDDYDGYKNLNLYAGYSRQSGIEILDYNDYDIVPEYVAGFGSAFGAIDKEATFTFNVGSNTSTTVTLKLPEGSDENDPIWIYDNVSLQITYSGMIFYDEEQAGAPRGTGNTFTIPLGSMPHGYRYDCFLEAQYNMISVSYPFTIDLRD